MMHSSIEVKRRKSEEEQHTREVKNVRVLEYLPEEILAKIFSFLEDSKDLESLSKASLKCSRIIGPTKQVWLFEQVFPLIFSELGHHDILNCRFVCTQWKKDVDNHLQSQPLTRVMEEYKPDYRTDTSNQATVRVPDYVPKFKTNLCMKRFMSAQFLGVSAIASFMESAKSHMGNPFVLRSITLDDGSYSGDEQNVYWASVFSLLTEFGKHIWHLYIHTCYDESRHLARYCYSMLRRCLSLLPNLRTLSVRGFIYHFYQTSPVSSNPERIARLQQYVQSYPLPELSSLQVMEIGLHMTQETQVVYNELLRTYLCTARAIISPLSLWRTPQCNETLEQLTRLEIFVDDSVYKFSRFCNLSNALNLEKLSLIIQEKVIFKDMIRSLDRFPKLQYLSLKFLRKPEDILEQSVPKCDLPQVKTLEVLDGPYVPYNLLYRHLSNLEYILVCADDQEWWKPGLDLYFSLGDDEKRHFHFQKAIFSLTMSGVSIWEVLKSLKEITLAWMGSDNFSLYEIVKTTTYTRDDREKMVMKEP